MEYRRDTERATKFIEEKRLTYTMVEDGEERPMNGQALLEVRAFPSSFLIGRHGNVMYFHLGFEAGEVEQSRKRS